MIEGGYTSIQVDILARELYLEFSNWILTHMRDIWTLRPGFYSRMVSPGEPFWENCLRWPSFQGYHAHFSRKMFPTWIFTSNVLESKELLSMDRDVHILTFMQKWTDWRSIHIWTFFQKWIDWPSICYDSLAEMDWPTVPIWTFFQK